jgi:hypothetical protein
MTNGMGARHLSAAIVALALAIPAAAASSPTSRTTSLSLTAPAQFDLTLAEVRFPTALTGRPSRLSVNGSPGLYYVAGALVRRPPTGGPRALVLVVNERPRGSLAPDRLRIGLRVGAAQRLGRPSLRQVVNPLTRPGAVAGAAFCGLTAHGQALTAGTLQGVLAAGRSLPGLGAAAAAAQAYDVACGLPSDPAFARAVSGACGVSLVAGCCPPNALCAVPTPPAPPPTPAPPPMPPPVCPPCPRPPCRVGTTCPLSASSGLVVLRIVCPLAAGPALAC